MNVNSKTADSYSAADTGNYLCGHNKIRTIQCEKMWMSFHGKIFIAILITSIATQQQTHCGKKIQFDFSEFTWRNTQKPFQEITEIKLMLYFQYGIQCTLYHPVHSLQSAFIEKSANNSI